jgi:DNA-binding winged helix-turn-helix (wHTH) protein/tetratricopeptide (TPR) repeat protein
MSASESQGLTELYEFGPFRVDPEKETLCRSGEPVPLTPKTFQILLVLVRHNKEVVTKDDLLKTVWPDTFVGEANLSRNIFMLRKALGESAQKRQYIITVPGRGYRLAESVRWVPESELSIIAASHSKVEIQVKETRPWGWISLAVILLLTVFAGTLRFFSHRKAVLSEKDTVVLAAFENSTGDSIFDGTLRQGMAVQLEQSPFLSLISDQRIQHTLRLMGRSADARLTPELAREVCERTGSAAVLDGSIASLGNQYVLGIRATNCRNGDILDEEQAQAARKEDVLNALSQMASKFRTRLGESLSTVERHNTPLAEATTPSLEALKAYSAAWRIHASSGAIAALPLFKRATEIDPNFAMAHASLGRIYADLDESDLAAESTTRAWELRGRASDREIFFITLGYETLVTGNLEAAQQTAASWVQTYPRDARPHNILSGMVTKSFGNYENAKAEAQKAIELDPDFGIGYYSLAVTNAYLNHLDEAEKTLRLAAGRGLEIDEFVMLEYDIAFLRDDHAAMERAADRVRGENWMSSREGFAAAYSGHLQQARSISRRAVNQAQQAGQLERAGLWEAGAAVREALFGNASEARTRATAALQISNDREVEYGAGFALASSGNFSQAQTLADDMERRFPEDTSVRFNYLPALRARLALNEGNPAKALEVLQVAVPHELGAHRSSVNGLFGALYPVYVRGEAYLAAGQGPEAAAEFQKILDHRGIVVSDPVGALARLQLGRAFALSGHTTKAKTAYQDFLTLWKDADPDIPILRQTKAEYAKLQ